MAKPCTGSEVLKLLVQIGSAKMKKGHARKLELWVDGKFEPANTK